MDCPQTDWLDDKEYMAAFRRRIRDERVPVGGGINLTHRCNLRCVHCYVRDYDGGDPDNKELKTDEILAILDQAVEAGCLSLLITGGEPLLHPGFKEVYRHARELGLLLKLFTNGTLIDPSHIELFRAFPPRYVEVTLYGATQETFDKVTGVSGSYDDCHRGIELLREGGVPFRLKTMLLTVNRHEFELMRDYAAELGVNFRFDPLVTPRLDGDLSPLQYRVDPVVATELSMADEEKIAEAVEDLRESGVDIGASSRTEFLYRCGTGSTSFFIDAFGHLQPCMMVSDPSVDLRNTSFREAWDEIASVRTIPAPPDLPCNNCSLIAYCGYCPPSIRQENGLNVAPSDYMCRLGKCRKRAIEEKL